MRILFMFFFYTTYSVIILMYLDVLLLEKCVYAHYIQKRIIVYTVANKQFDLLCVACMLFIMYT